MVFEIKQIIYIVKSCNNTITYTYCKYISFHIIIKFIQLILRKIYNYILKRYIVVNIHYICFFFLIFHIYKQIIYEQT
jgi:hypothetical protein